MEINPSSPTEPCVISFASFRRFWPFAARRNSSRAPLGPVSLRLTFRALLRRITWSAGNERSSSTDAEQDQFLPALFAAMGPSFRLRRPRYVDPDRHDVPHDSHISSFSAAPAAANPCCAMRGEARAFLEKPYPISFPSSSSHKNWSKRPRSDTQIRSNKTLRSKVKRCPRSDVCAEEEV